MTTTGKPLRSVLWVAVSSQIQASKDKISLGEQERLEREYCDLRGWQVIDVLRVEGHSRSDSDILTLLDDYRRLGVDAYERIRAHWKACDFDCLIAFDASRLARSQTLYSYVVENVIKAGAAVHLIQGGEINEQNSEMGIAMGGLAATSGMKRFKHLTKAAFEKRIESGLSGNVEPGTHRQVYNERGKAIRLELRHELRQLFDDAATLLLEGTAWNDFGYQMHARFGHTNPETGAPYSWIYFYDMFHAPYTWGYSARGYADKWGRWSFDPSEVVPDGVIINRSPNPPVPPVYTGEMAENIKSELRRRGEIKGRARPATTHKFTGVLVCDECGHSLSIGYGGGATPIVYWKCHWAKKKHGPRCTQTRYMRDSLTQSQISDYFEDMIRQGQSDIAATIPPDDSLKDRTETLTAEINKLNRRLDMLILNEADAPIGTRERYTKQIIETGERKDTLDKELKHLQAGTDDPDKRQGRIWAFDEMLEGGLKAFWLRTPREINQVLHRVLGVHKFRVREGKIVGVR